VSRLVVISLIVFVAVAACSVISLVIAAMNAEIHTRREFFGTAQSYPTTGGQQMQPEWK
jgi:Ti type entry exclusion protein TrbK